MIRSALLALLAACLLVAGLPPVPSGQGPAAPPARAITPVIAGPDRKSVV